MPLARPAPVTPVTTVAAGVTSADDLPPDASGRFLGTVLSATVIAGVGLLAAMVLGAARQVVVGRAMGPIGLGVIGLAESIENVLIRIAPLGLTASIPLLVSKRLAAGGQAEAGRLLGTGTVLGLGLAAAAAVVAAIVALPMSALAGGPDTLPTLVSWAVVIFGLTVCQVAASGLRGLLSIASATVVRDVLPNFLVLGFVVVGLGVGLGLPEIALVYGCGAVVAAGFGLWLVWRAAGRGGLGFAFEPAGIGPLLALSLPVLLIAASGQLIRQINVPVLAASTDLATVGEFTAALMFASAVEGVFIALNLVYLPLASRALATDGPARIAALQPAVGRWTALATLGPVLFLVILAEPVVDFLFGPAFAGAAVPIRIICVGLLVQAVIGPRNAILLALGAARQVTVAFMAALGVVLATSLVLIPVFGLAGAAVSFASGTVTRSLLAWLFLSRSLSGAEPRARELAALVIVPFVALGPSLAGPVGPALAAGAAILVVVVLFGSRDDVDRFVVGEARRRLRQRR